MARTVNPRRHAARRLAIIDAALTCFATEGYAGATTATICRQAGIASGTFFHYFPTKHSLLVAILDLGAQETSDWFGGQEHRRDAARVVLDYVEHAASELSDPRLPGFIRAVGAVMGEPDVAAALARDEEATRAGLLPWVARAQQANQFRTDVDTDRLTEWVLAIIDGYTGRLATPRGLEAAGEQAMLVETVARLTRP